MFTNNIHIYFSDKVHACVLYIHTLCYIHTVDTYMAAVCINVCIFTFNVYITALACFNGYVRAATLITDRSQIDYGKFLLWLLIAVTETWHLQSTSMHS